MSTLDITTEISASRDGHHHIRGIDILTLMGERTLTEVLFLLWRKDFPSPEERMLLESMLVASVEHGVEPPSAFVPRVVASTGNPMNVALAASALTIGEKHGGAIEAAATMLMDERLATEIVAERLQEGRVIPGLGHKIYTDEDPRATVLKERAKALKFPGGHFEKMDAIATAFADQKGKRLPVNVDGALAAGLRELKFDPRLGKALFIVPRMIGAAAHVLEELDSNVSYRRLTSSRTP